MSIGDVLAAIGAGAGGYVRGRRARMEDDAAQQENEFKQQQRAQIQAQWQRDQQERDALSQAAQPTQVQTVAAPANPDTTDPNTGETIRERPLPDTYSVNGQNFGADQQAAGDAATQYNSPRMVALRQAAAIQGLDPNKAMQMRTSANAEQMQGLQLDDAQRKHLDTLFMRSLEGANSHQALAQVLSDSKADGQDGAVKFDVVQSPDGSQVSYVKINPDGTKTALPGTFSNDEKGLEKAKMVLNDRLPPDVKLTHLHQQSLEDMERQKITEQARHDKATEDNFAERSALQLEAAQLRAALRASAAGAASSKADHFGEKEWDAAAKIDKEMTGIDDGTGRMVPSPDLRVARQAAFNQARASGQYSPQEAAERADTAVALIRQKAEARVKAAPKDKPLSTTDAIRQVIQEANSVNPGAPRGGQPAPAAPARARPGMDASAAPAPGTAPAGPVPFQQFLAANITTPEGKREIAARIQSERQGLWDQLAADARVVATPGIEPTVKASLQQRIEQNKQTLEAMQAFLDGNPMASY